MSLFRAGFLASSHNGTTGPLNLHSSPKVFGSCISLGEDCMPDPMSGSVTQENGQIKLVFLLEKSVVHQYRTIKLLVH